MLASAADLRALAQPGLPLAARSGSAHRPAAGPCPCGRQVNSPLQVTDRPRRKARRLRQLLLHQPGIGAQLPQQPPETRRSLLRHGPHRPFTSPGPLLAARTRRSRADATQALQQAYMCVGSMPKADVIRSSSGPGRHAPDHQVRVDAAYPYVLSESLNYFFTYSTSIPRLFAVVNSGALRA